MVASVALDEPAVTRSGVVMGVGMGGFVDGIVLHQILQWHNMGSAVLRPDTMMAMKQNMVRDGLFQAAGHVPAYGRVFGGGGVLVIALGWMLTRRDSPSIQRGPV